MTFAEVGKDVEPAYRLEEMCEVSRMLVRMGCCSPQMVCSINLVPRSGVERHLDVGPLLWSGVEESCDMTGHIEHLSLTAAGD